MKKSFILCLVFVVALTFSVTGAFAQPSSKVAAKASYIAAVPLSSNSAAASGSDSATSGWVDLWTDPLVIKPPNDKDLVMTFAAECGLVTDTTVMSKKLARAAAKAEAIVEIRVLVDDIPVPVGNKIMDGDVEVRDGASIIYARRSQELIAHFGGSFDTCGMTDGGAYIITDACLEQEDLRLILDTMTANSFIFIAPDLDPVDHEIMVQAKLSYNTDLSYDVDGGADASATAFLGYTSFTIDTVRMAKGDEPVVME